MGYNNKDITITLRMNKETNLKLQELCEIEQQNLYNSPRTWRVHTVKKSQMIRCLIEAICQMPEEERKKWLAEHYDVYD